MSSAKSANPPAIDPTNVHVKTQKGGFGLNVVCKDDTNAMFTIVTPPMLLMNPRLTGEGDLGHAFKNRKGQEICQDDRTKCKFSMGIGIGDMDDEALRAAAPNLKAEQRECLVKIYETGRNILGNLFDQRLEDFLPKITEFEADAISAETDRLMVMPGSTVKTEADVRRMMEADDKLRERIADKARAKFISKASFMFPNPADFDEDGNQRDEDGKNKRLAVYMKRKCWKRKREFATKPAREMPVTPSAKQLDPSLISNWPAILERMGTHYEWNPLKFYDGDSDVQMERPLRTIKGETVVDPTWTPVPDTKQSLICLRLMFGVFTVDSNYGVKVMPCPDVYIIRQRKMDRSGIDMSAYKAITTGFAAEKRGRDEDDQGSEDGSGAGKRAKPAVPAVVPPMPPADEDHD